MMSLQTTMSFQPTVSFPRTREPLFPSLASHQPTGSCPSLPLEGWDRGWGCCAFNMLDADMRAYLARSTPTLALPSRGRGPSSAAGEILAGAHHV